MKVRRLGRVVGTAWLLTVALLVLPIKAAGACSCAGPPPGQSTDYKSASDAAFLGDVIALRLDDPESVIQGQARLASPEVVYTFDVQAVYKGEVTRHQEVLSNADGAACGVGFELNRRYVVYASASRVADPDETRKLATGLCMGSYEPDGVNTFPPAGGAAVQGAVPEASPVPPGDVLHPLDEPGARPIALVGVLLLSAALAGAVIRLAGRS